MAVAVIQLYAVAQRFWYKPAVAAVAVVQEVRRRVVLVAQGSACRVVVVQLVRAQVLVGVVVQVTQHHLLAVPPVRRVLVVRPVQSVP